MATTEDTNSIALDINGRPCPIAAGLVEFSDDFTDLPRFIATARTMDAYWLPREMVRLMKADCERVEELSYALELAFEAVPKSTDTMQVEALLKMAKEYAIATQEKMKYTMSRALVAAEKLAADSNPKH
jgi:hypothetical protein